MAAPIAIPGNQYQFAGAKQSAQGTSNTVMTSFPRWANGTAMQPTAMIDQIRQGDGSPDIGYAVKKGQLYKGKTALATSRTIDAPFWMKACMGTGSDAVSGAGPYTHALTPKPQRDFYTLQGLWLPPGGTNVGLQINDAVVHTMTITGEAGKPLLFEFEYAGITGSPITSLGATWTGDADSNPLLFYGGSFNVDGSLVGTVAPYIKKFVYKYAYPLDEEIRTEHVTNDTFISTARTITVDYEVLFQDFTQLKKTYWNSGVADSATIGQGSIDLKFYPQGDNTQTKYLEIAVPTINYSAAEPPPGQLDGKGLWQSVKGTAQSGASPITTITAVNGQTTAY